MGKFYVPLYLQFGVILIMAMLNGTPVDGWAHLQIHEPFSTAVEISAIGVLVAWCLELIEILDLSQRDNAEADANEGDLGDGA